MQLYIKALSGFLTIEAFLGRHLRTAQPVKTGALPALNAVGKGHEHLKKMTPPEEANTWLPLVHIMIGNMKKMYQRYF